MSISAGGSPPRFPPIKSRAYSASASPLHTFYHSEAESGDEAKKRGLLCTLLLWSTVALIILLLFVALFLAALFLIYRPRLPAFSLSSLSVKELAVSAASASVASRIDVTVKARNGKLRFEYDSPLRVSVAIGGVDVADGKFPGFVQGTRRTTVLREKMGSGGKRQVTGVEVRSVADGVRNGVATVEVRLDGKVRALFGKLRSPAMVLQVRCKGLKAAVPGSGRSAAVGSGKCEVKFRWTV